MKYLLLLFATLLPGCAVTKPSVYVPPSSIAVFKSVQGVREKVDRIKPFVKPEGAATVRDLEQQVEATQSSLESYVAQVDTLTTRTMNAENAVVRLEAQHYKDLRIIWRWRLLALAIVAAVVAYVGMRTAWKFAL